PSSYHRRFLDDTPGDSAWLAAAATGHPNLGRRLWPDLPPHGELAADGGDVKPRDWLQAFERPRCCLWNRGVGDDAGNHRSPVCRYARDLGVAATGGDRDRGGGFGGRWGVFVCPNYETRRGGGGGPSAGGTVLWGVAML